MPSIWLTVTRLIGWVGKEFLCTTLHSNTMNSWSSPTGSVHFDAWRCWRVCISACHGLSIRFSNSPQVSAAARTRPNPDLTAIFVSEAALAFILDKENLPPSASGVVSSRL
ncbi:hypothetical protein SCLCIDRAFT_401749 [Scleroderma citrinum Foug A]|uniref:Uncharacterized protein n=1 Tax=Scleroderma citrinum Foug A TaxID=1036808 RepID=A0A0C3DD74_9AGAM|nr:hypothetical protein SCLCIDRAFT_401749 [Scleroderma citrinum Foug A]